MASQKEERARRRAERQAAARREAEAARRRLLAGYVVAGLLSLAVVVGLVIVLTSGDGGDGADGGNAPEEAHVQIGTGSTNDVPFDDREGTEPPAPQVAVLEDAADAAGCELDLGLPDEGNTHIGSNPDKAPDYETSPPTSGNHIDPGFQQADGAYIEQPADAFVVHSLEHGRVAIQYSPDLSDEEQLALKGVFDESPAGVLLFPNADMPYDMAAAAWTQLIGCKTYEGAATLDAIRAFRDIYRGQGPEDVPLVVAG